MADQILSQREFYGGISIGKKQGQKASYRFGQSIDITSDPNEFKLTRLPSKVSGSTVTGLVKWIADGSPHDTNRYFYDDGGKIYRETSGGTWSSLRTVANSSGQGLAVHDDYLYYTQDTQIGRYGPLSGSPTFTDDWQTGLNDTSTSGFAPIMIFKEGFAVGNGNDLAWWDGSVWDQDRVVVPPGFDIRALTTFDEFIIMGAWSGTVITESEEGFVFLWDGSSTTFNNFFPTDSAPNALTNARNRLVSVIGSQGNIYLDAAPFSKAHQIPGVTNKQNIEIFPGAMTQWQNKTYVGVAGSTDSTDLQQGVYSWGAKSDFYPDALNFEFPISTNTLTGTTLKIGSVLGIGNDLYFGWRDGSTYGVDKVSASSNFAASGKYESMIFDDLRVHSDKSPKVIKITHLALVANESVQIGYKLDRASSFTTGSANSTVGDVETRLPLDSKRFREMELQVAIATSDGLTTPTVTSVNMLYDDLKEERIF